MLNLYVTYSSPFSINPAVSRECVTLRLISIISGRNVLSLRKSALALIPKLTKTKRINKMSIQNFWQDIRSKMMIMKHSSKGRVKILD